MNTFANCNKCLCLCSVPGFRCFSSSASCLVLLYLLLLRIQKQRILDTKKTSSKEQFVHFPSVWYDFYININYLNYAYPTFVFNFVSFLKAFSKLYFLKDLQQTEGDNNKRRARQPAGKHQMKAFQTRREEGQRLR